jgi:ribosomal protein L37AE/L43A
MLPRGTRRLLPWLAPLAFLAAAGIGVAIVRAGPLAWFGLVLGLLALVPAGWVLVSALWPARAERTCPSCRKPALARLSKEATHGLVCRACGWKDESASAWLLAEEEEGLERLVLAERRRSSNSRGELR